MSTSAGVRNYTMPYKTPDGMATIIITDEDKPTIQIIVGKSGSSVAAWAHALAEMINWALEARSLDEVIDKLAEISTDRAVFHKGVTCRSTAEAVSFALLTYSRIRQKKNESN